MNVLEFEPLNSLNTEVIILSADDLSTIWINDSAKAANWIPESSPVSYTHLTLPTNREE